jgi:hypothetical protein
VRQFEISTLDTQGARQEHLGAECLTGSEKRHSRAWPGNVDLENRRQGKCEGRTREVLHFEPPAIPRPGRLRRGKVDQV